jgi:hypothetical protein
MYAGRCIGRLGDGGRLCVFGAWLIFYGYLRVCMCVCVCVCVYVCMCICVVCVYVYVRGLVGE